MIMAVHQLFGITIPLRYSPSVIITGTFVCEAAEDEDAPSEEIRYIASFLSISFPAVLEQLQAQYFPLQTSSG